MTSFCLLEPVPLVHPSHAPNPPARPDDAWAQQFRAVFEHAPIGISLVATDRVRRLQVNHAFCRMLGYSEAELLGAPLSDTTHPEDIAADLQLRAELLAGTREVYEREKRYLHKDGHLVWGRMTCSLARDADGRPLCFIAQVQDITERRRAEQELRDSEARFRGLCRLSADWYWEQDADLRFTALEGDARLGTWGSEAGELLGRQRWEIAGLTPLAGTWDDHRAVLEARQPFRDFQYRRAVPGLPVSYVSASGEPVFGPDRRFLGYRGTARDITQARVAQERLAQAQALLHMAAQIGRLGGWSWERGQDRIFWSGEVCAIHEVRSDFMPTLDEILAFVVPQHQPALRATLAACMQDGTPFDTEVQVVTRKGRLLWVRMIGEADWDAHGRVQRVQGACQDISEARRAAEQNRRMAEQLTTTLESFTDAFFTVDRQWRFTYLNGEAERMLRRPRVQLLGRPLWLEFPGLRGTVFERQYARALAENVTVQFEEPYEPFGIWVHVKVFPSPQGLAIYVRDVTERVTAQREILRLNAELEERVRQRTAQLEAANQELEAFSYSIAHDLRAPLGSIDGFSQMLEQSAGGSLPGRCPHYLARIRAGVRQMGELTDGLLALAHLSRSSMRWEPVDLADLARAALATLREADPQRVAEEVVAARMPVSGDPRMLAQVMGNLVGNAWKFTGHTEHARIEVGSVTEPGGRVVHHVRDNGAGFEMAHASRLFEAFQRMHGAAEFEGTGIGLAIVHKIVTRHGGSIWAEAAPGRGATFYFTLGDAPA